MRTLIIAAALIAAGPALAACPYDENCLDNPYGAGSRYGGLADPYSNNSYTNPYATNAPVIVDQNGGYHGRLSANPYAQESTGNPYGRYGSPYSSESINNPYGAGNPYGGNQYRVYGR